MSEYFYFENDYVRYLEPNNNEHIDLYLAYCGIEYCCPSHSFGPAIRDQYLLHYIIDGKGTFKANNKTYTLGKKQGFLINPNELTYYEADKDEPWKYIWVSFNGIKAREYLKHMNLDSDKLIFHCDYSDDLKKCVLDMLKIKSISYADELKLQSLLYLFLSILAKDYNKNGHNNSSFEKIYIKKSVEFIYNNFSHNIKITDIANYVGLNRSYLYTLFKKNLNLSPQQFLFECRINKAFELLKYTNLSINDISNSIGYQNSLTFSKIFKKYTGLSPKQYRIKEKAQSK